MKSALFYLVSFGLFAGAVPGLAKDREALPVNPNADRVRFVTDQQAGTVTITIDGVPTVRIDKTGMQVSGSITYGGEIADRPLTTAGARAR